MRLCACVCVVGCGCGNDSGPYVFLYACERRGVYAVQVVPATARVAVSTADVENQQKPAVKKMKLLGKGPAIALSGASLRAMTGAGGLPLGL